MMKMPSMRADQQPIGRPIDHRPTAKGLSVCHHQPAHEGNNAFMNQQAGKQAGRHAFEGEKN